jgi:hypothetical protein
MGATWRRFESYPRKVNQQFTCLRGRICCKLCSVHGCEYSLYWSVTRCNCVGGERHFGETCFFHHQGWCVQGEGSVGLYKQVAERNVVLKMAILLSTVPLRLGPGFSPHLQLAYASEPIPYPAHLNTVDRHNMFLRNVGIYLKVYMVSTRKTAIWMSLLPICLIVVKRKVILSSGR